jgi:hypothetical protein
MSSPTHTNNRGTFSWIPIAVAIPPSMTIPEREKDERYHALWTRYFLSRQVSTHINYFRDNFVSNMDYAIDSRWGEEDDVRMFLGDSAAMTSRIPFKFPIMSPMLTQLIGITDAVSISAKASPATQYFAQTRREEMYAKAMVLSNAAQAGPMVAEAYASQGISPDQAETDELFDMTYQDHIVRGANSIMAMIAERNQFEVMKRAAAGYLGLSGDAAAHCFVSGNTLQWEICEPREYGWDTSSMRADRSDGQFMYVCPLMSVTAIAEQWNPVAGKIKALDMWSRILPAGYNFNAGWPQSRPRVFTMYWKDMKYVDRGYVMKDGVEQFVTINEINPDTGKPDFTDDDLIEPPQNIYTECWEPSEIRSRKQRRGIELIRYCSMIPWEYLPGGYTKFTPFNSDRPAPRAMDNTGLPDVGVSGDMILDWGVYPLQEADPDDVYSVKFPIKMSAWRYYGGHCVAPLTAARDPQRWINQIASDAAWRMRKAGGTSPIIAKEAIDGSNMDEAEAAQKIKEGDLLVIPAAQLGGLNNASGKIDTSPGAGFYNLLGVLPQMKSIAESSVGLYDVNAGAPGNGDQTGIAMQTQLRQSGVMQQPYLASLAYLFEQMHQFDAQAGKQFFCKRPWLLEQMVGDDDMKALIASEEMQLEQFRVKIDLAPNAAQERMETDAQVIPMLLQMGMLDAVTAAQLMGRSTKEDAYAAARKFSKQAAAAAAEQQRMAQAAQAQAGLDAEQAELDGAKGDLAKAQQQQEINREKLQQKLAQPLVQANADWMKPPKEAPGGKAPLTPGT